jgi:large subunit ribosomal protein L29
VIVEGAKAAMNAAELRDKTPDQLRDTLDPAEEGSVQPALPPGQRGPWKTPRRCGSVRRDVARVKTMLNEKAAQPAAAEGIA